MDIKYKPYTYLINQDKELKINYPYKYTNGDNDKFKNHEEARDFHDALNEAKIKCGQFLIDSIVKYLEYKMDNDSEMKYLLLSDYKIIASLPHPIYLCLEQYLRTCYHTSLFTSLEKVDNEHNVIVYNIHGFNITITPNFMKSNIFISFFKTDN